jgi:hypothetical protein
MTAVQTGIGLKKVANQFYRNQNSTAVQNHEQA